MATIRYYHYHKDEHTLKFHKKAEDGDNPLYLGAELEVDKGGYDSDEATKFENCFGVVDGDDEFLMFESDGSINSGFEIITDPATLAFHRSIREMYQNGFKALVADGYRSYNTDTCGLHIHANKDYFTDEGIEVLLSVFDKLWDDIEKFSRRDKDSLDHWAKKSNKTPKEIVEQMNEDRSWLDRYSAINLQNRTTVEFRLFKGTLNPTSFFASLEFVNNVCKWSMTHSLDDVENLSIEDLLESDETKDFWNRVKNRIVY